MIPVEPEPVEKPTLTPLPPKTDPSFWAVRTKNAELAGLYLQGQRDAEQEARIKNARMQEICAAWSKEH